VAGYPGDLATLDAGAVGQIPNVGKAIAAKIGEYLRTGRIHQLDVS
jgi:DNA polymerase (family X)